MKKIKQNIFQQAKKSSSVSQGMGGFDNVRENIDPHVKTQVIDTKELVQNGVSYDLSALGGGVDWTVSQAPAVVHADNYTDTNDDTTAHASFTQLDYANAGHTGFEPAKGADDNFVTDAEKTVVGNTSGANTGDQDITGIGTNTTAIGLNTGSLVTNTTAIALNTTHRSSNGQNHADVVSNNTHRADNSQAHSDYLINNGNDTSSGTITAAGFTTTGVTLTGDHGTAATDQVVNVCYGTSATPPTANTTTIGTLYIKYTA